MKTHIPFQTGFISESYQTPARTIGTPPNPIFLSLTAEPLNLSFPRSLTVEPLNLSTIEPLNH